MDHSDEKFLIAWGLILHSRQAADLPTALLINE